MAQAKQVAGWRGSADMWLNAAYDLLLEQGVDAVRILPLAEKLNLSRTSFYWFFRDHQKLLDALVARWREKNTDSLVKQANAYAETLAEAVLNIFDLWLDIGLFDSRFEFAVRSWALQSSAILMEVRQADQIRLESIKSLFLRFGHDELSADVRSRSLYLVQIGYISMQTREDIDLRMKRIPHYVEIFAGQKPQQRELERFHARHGYKES